MKNLIHKTTTAIICFVALSFGAMAQEDNKIVIDGSTTVGPIAKVFAQYFMRKNPGIDVSVAESGSGNGAKALINSTCDVADMSRPMKDKEFKAAAEKGVQPVAHVVALDGLPILVHPSNPIDKMTMQQVQDVYLGTITNWKELGGPDRRIVVISRDTSSGTYETFHKMVMKKKKIHKDVKYVNSNGMVREGVQNNPAAIGYAGLGFITGVKALKINGIEPSAQTVRSGVYPIARPLFMYTDKYPKMGGLLYRFLTIHLTEEGQEMIEKIGYVPVTSY